MKPALLVVALAALVLAAARPLSLVAAPESGVAPPPAVAPALETRTVYVAADVERGQAPAEDGAERDDGTPGAVVQRHWLRPDGERLAARMNQALRKLAGEGWSLAAALPVTAGETVSAATAGKTGWGVPSGVAFGHGTSATLGVLLVLERPKP